MSEGAAETYYSQWREEGAAKFKNGEFDAAIDIYTKAIVETAGDAPINAIFYSNRSACYASKGQWQQSMEDAESCVKKDNKFVKGYYRLATAYSELGRFDDAELALNSALKIEPDNELVIKQLKSIKSKRIAVQASSALKESQKKVQKKLSNDQIKEAMELQDQINSYSRDLRSVQSRIAALQRDSRALAVTESQIQQLPPAIPLYRAVGKAFVLADRSSIEANFEKEVLNITRNQRDLGDRKEYLERRISSSTQNLKDLVSG